MHSMNVKLGALVEKLTKSHGKRLLALSLVIAVVAGILFAFPVMADEQTAEETETAQPAQVAVCTFKMLENNLEALKAATVSTTAVFTGDVVSLYNVTVKADGEKSVLCMPEGSTVADAVSASGLKLNKADTLNVSKKRYLTDELTVKVTRVGYKEYEKRYAVDYSTEIRYTSELRQGATKVLQYGKEGVRTVTYRQKLENGKVVSTKQIDSEITTQPIKKIVLIGTKVGKIVSEAPFAIKLDSAGQPVKYKKKLYGECTAYTTDRGDSGAWTATGRRAQVGVVAVDPRVIPYGTKLWIVSADGKIVYGYAIAGDTGGAVCSGRVLVDLYYDTYGECSSFGRRNMNVYVIG